MTTAEKALRLKQDLDEVFDAGYAAGAAEGGQDNSLYYATHVGSIFESVTFPENYHLVLRFKNVPYEFYRTVALAKNLKSVKIITEDKESPISFTQAFRECQDLETVDLTECSRKIGRADYAFYQASKTWSILGALDLSECTDASLLNYGFFMSSLREVRFVPGTIKVSVRFNSAYLTDESTESIIDGLADLTGGATQTLTLNGVGAKLTAEQRERITAKNWTLAY